MSLRRRWSVASAAFVFASVVGWIGVPPPGSASTCSSTTWTGNVDDEWTTSGNWLNGVPATCSEVDFMDNSPHPDIVDVPTITLNTLSISGGVSLTGDDDTVITASALTWSDGTSNVSLVASQSLNILGGGTHVLVNGNDVHSETLTNTSDALQTGGATLELDHGAVAVNDGVWATTSPPSGGAVIKGIVCCASFATFVNEGTLDGDGNGISIMNMRYDGTATGVVNGLVVLDAGTHVLENGTAVSGTDANLDVVDGATVAVGGTIHLDKGGRITQEHGTIVNGTGVTFEGAGVHHGSYRWTGGTIFASPTFDTGADLVVSGADGKTLDGTTGSAHGVLTVETTATEQGTGALSLSGAAVVDDGLWEIPANQDVTVRGASCCASSRPLFRDNGEVRIAATSTFDFSNAHFTAAPTGVVEGGTFDLGAGEHPFDSGSRFLNGVDVVLDRSATVAGSGLMTFQQGATLEQTDGATISGVHDMEGSGTYRWTSGTISGGLDLGPGIATKINDLASDPNHNRSLTSTGPTPASLTVEGGAVQNSATPVSLGAGDDVTNRIGSTWTIQNGGLRGGVCCASPAVVSNLGTLVVKASAAGTSGTLELLAFRNRGSFKVNAGTASFLGVSPIQTAGSTSVAGTLSTNLPFQLKAGTFGGAGKVTGSLENTGGTLSPGAPIGTLHVSGDYTQSNGGTFAADLKNAAVDLLVVGGTADLGGTLKLHLAQSGALTRSIRTLLSAHSVSSPFTTVAGLGTLGSPWAVKDTASRVRLLPV
ncbi:MAG TPA: hypothetical protein VNN79_25735 [Actinomycetota bacterium]|nr:hypothetical protein [Actinomycetota bacterium]